jgi:penicillin V acylase-like amidase (Ntn superfamily)
MCSAVIGRISIVLYLVILFCLLFFVKVAHACTGNRLIAGDGTVVYARTLEFGVDRLSIVSVYSVE